MRILFLVNRNNAHGGAFKIMTWLANSLVNEHEVTYCNLNNDVPFFKLDSRIHYVNLDCVKKSNFLYRNTIGLVQSIYQLVQLEKKGKYDFCINFSDHSFYPLVISKIFTKIKIVVSQRVDPYSCNKKSDKIRLWLYRYCNGIVCQTNSALTYFKGKVPNKVKLSVIPNPALRKAKKYWNDVNNEGYLLSLARLDFKQKRQDVLLDAFKITHEKYPNLKLYLYGLSIGNEEKELIEMIEKRGLTGAAIYKGVTNNSLEVIRKSKILLLTSDYEGIPNVILEGMDVGVPIISTDCKPGGAKLLLDDDSKGIIVPRDNPKEFAKAISFYIENPKIARKNAKTAQDSLERFSEKKIINSWQQFLELI